MPEGMHDIPVMRCTCVQQPFRIAIDVKVIPVQVVGVAHGVAGHAKTKQDTCTDAAGQIPKCSSSDQYIDPTRDEFESRQGGGKISRFPS